MDIESCMAEGFLKRVKPSKEIQKKELASADYDLKRAEASSEDGDHKWSIIQSYYAIFHSARALLDSLGYKERRHFAIGVVLEDLAKDKKINVKLVSDFHAAMSAREDADYRDVYSKETSDYMIEISEEFVKEIKRILIDDENKKKNKSKEDRKKEENENDA
ncbi:MAG: HEPN domain-containing protein [Candidatus Aenigmarchaeota archaeon]|nr:HEPN domain-containing protein [Candidatus Aenigmarchaeota archaeon]